MSQGSVVSQAKHTCLQQPCKLLIDYCRVLNEWQRIATSQRYVMLAINLVEIWSI